MDKKEKEFKITKNLKVNNKSAKRNYSHQTGITLIALVVTIVVLLILAGVSINALFGDSGIIQKAKDAQNKMDQAKQNDLAGIDELNNWLNENSGEGGNNNTTLKSYNEASKENGILKENAVYTDDEDVTVTIPKGFKVSDVEATADTDGEQTVSKGLVIQDANGNEFVWIPVNYTATGVDANNNQLDDGFEATFKRTRANNTSCSEPFKYNDGENELTGYSEENSDYMNMMKSVQANKGFYIGRYEAGSVDEDGNNIARTNSTTNTSKVVVKRDAYPYIYVCWGKEMNDITTDVTINSQVIGKGAVYLSKKMYGPDDIGATSCLCYGVQWDAVMNFVADSTHSITNSTNWGNCFTNPWTINRTTASFTTNPSSGGWSTISSEKTKTNDEGILLTTGASDSFKAKNIFDLAGNVWEWTMEAHSGSSRAARGGGCFYYSSPASDTYATNPSYSNHNFGFRPALYL